MGNAQPNWGQQNSLFIRTDQPNYVAGQVVTGSVYVQILVPCNPTSITLQLNGFDQAEWWWKEAYQVEDGRNEDGSPRYRTEWRERFSWEGRPREASIRNFFQVTCPLFQNFNMWGGVFPPGAYQFPFQFQLPPGLPGDFSEVAGLGNDTGYAAKVVYTLRAFLDCPGFNQDVFHEQPLIIDEQVRNPLVGIYKNPTFSQQVKMCCCIDKGIVTVDCTFDASFYQVGQVVNAIVSIDNQSECEIKNLNVKLCRYMRLRSHASSMRKDFGRDVLNTLSFPGVPPKTTKLNIPCGVQCIARHGQPAVQPQTTNPNPMASVHVTYKVQVECSIDWAPDVDIYMPIEIYQAIPQWLPPQAPMGFQPQAMPLANVQFGFQPIAQGW